MNYCTGENCSNQCLNFNYYNLSSLGLIFVEAYTSRWWHSEVDPAICCFNSASGLSVASVDGVHDLKKRLIVSVILQSSLCAATVSFMFEAIVTSTVQLRYESMPSACFCTLHNEMGVFPFL